MAIWACAAPCVSPFRTGATSISGIPLARRCGTGSPSRRLSRFSSGRCCRRTSGSTLWAIRTRWVRRGNRCGSRNRWKGFGEARNGRTRNLEERESMDHFFDETARILATSMPRRKALRLIGGALAAAVVAAIGVQPAGAADCQPKLKCGTGRNQICCAATQCCAGGAEGSGARCCNRFQCTCASGICAASTGGRCPQGCHLCDNDRIGGGGPPGSL